jgi:ADP-heptose:LPS heptosyltransferase
MTDSGSIRKIDRIAGRLICGFLSLIHAGLPRKPRGPIRRVLIIELFEMGASIMAYPALNYIKRAIEGAEIFCLCTDSVKQSWELLEVVPKKNIITVSGKTPVSFVFSLLRAVLQLRRLKFDLAIDLELFMRIPAIIAFLSGARLRAGFHRYLMEGLYRGNFYDYRVAFNQNAHISKNFMSVVQAALHNKTDMPTLKAAIAPEDMRFAHYRPDPEIGKAVAAKIRRLRPDFDGGPLVIVCPAVGRTLAVRNYPRESFVKVISAILDARPDHHVLLIGVTDDREICAATARDVNNPRCIDFCCQTANLRELIELLARSSLLIGNDNGPLHFASLTDCRILGLFSTDSPYVYGPMGTAMVLYGFFQCSPCIFAYNQKIRPVAMDAALGGLRLKRWRNSR